mmetsp:Transcript_41140/g.109064  ORF Transcript_41140/g.109064 Transcript_41140/m.109064 type:complete len:413 (-) Transcript_41140:532-1770(-)
MRGRSTLTCAGKNWLTNSKCRALRTRFSGRHSSRERRGRPAHVARGRVPAIHPRIAALERVKGSGPAVVAVDPGADAIADDREVVQRAHAQVKKTFAEEEVLSPRVPGKLVPATVAGVLVYLQASPRDRLQGPKHHRKLWVVPVAPTIPDVHVGARLVLHVIPQPVRHDDGVRVRLDAPVEVQEQGATQDRVPRVHEQLRVPRRAVLRDAHGRAGEDQRAHLAYAPTWTPSDVPLRLADHREAITTEYACSCRELRLHHVGLVAPVARDRPAKQRRVATRKSLARPRATRVVVILPEVLLEIVHRRLVRQTIVPFWVFPDARLPCEHQARIAVAADFRRLTRASIHAFAIFLVLVQPSLDLLETGPHREAVAAVRVIPDVVQYIQDLPVAAVALLEHHARGRNRGDRTGHRP